MDKKQWNRAFKRMLKEANQKVAEHNKEWKATFQRLADEWNEMGKQIARR